MPIATSDETRRPPGSRETTADFCRLRASPALPSDGGSSFKTILWIVLGLTVLFVFITSELLLVVDYPMYHTYRQQVIADRHLLIPHTLSGIIALFAGPLQFSSRLRQRH